MNKFSSTKFRVPRYSPAGTPHRAYQYSQGRTLSSFFEDVEWRNLHDEVEEFTGFVDCNDTEIYENDYIRIPNDYFTPDNGEPEYVVKQVIWAEGQWNAFAHALYEWLDDIEVIGNPVETPDLAEIL